jgi:hypothetical protein
MEWVWVLGMEWNGIWNSVINVINVICGTKICTLWPAVGTIIALKCGIVNPELYCIVM